MGRFLPAFACVLVCAVTSSAVAGGVNPMHWPKTQWRSSTFDSYALHPRTHRVRVIKHVVRVRFEPAAREPVAPVQAAARPLVIRNGSPMASAGPVDSRPACDGVLVVTWEGDHARSSCLKGMGTARP